jgi:hypothetical protein
MSLFKILVLCFSIIAGAASVAAQTTEFIHRGTLPNSIVPATGSFEMQIRLFDAAEGGTQVGSVLTLTNVESKNRDFAINLDLGAIAFPGADRFIELRIRQQGSDGPFIIVLPRDRILSVPYAVRALTAGTADSAVHAVTADTATNAEQLGGVAADQFLQIDGNGSGLTNLNANSITTGTLAVGRGGTGLTASGPAGNYLRSDGATWVSSVLLAADIPAGSGNYIQNRISQQVNSNFSISGDGRAGGTLSANIVNASTQYNIGNTRMLHSKGGTTNVFAGANAGAANTGANNSFFGRIAGQDNTSGGSNSFFGSFAGSDNTSGSSNSFFGFFAGQTNTTGSSNSFFGDSAGALNTSGELNSFFGKDAGVVNTTGVENSFFGRNAGLTNTTGRNNTLLGESSNVGSQNLTYATALGSDAEVTGSNRVQLGRDGFDKVSIGLLDTGGFDEVCMNGTILAFCSSSRRYKENVMPFTGGLELVRGLRPVTFDWRGRQRADLGLIAEEVADVEPLLVTHNRKDEIEGVKYDQIVVVLINAVKEQQKQIENQQMTIGRLQRRLAVLEKKQAKRGRN